MGCKGSIVKFKTSLKANIDGLGSSMTPVSTMEIASVEMNEYRISMTLREEIGPKECSLNYYLSDI